LLSCHSSVGKVRNFDRHTNADKLHAHRQQPDRGTRKRIWVSGACIIYLVGSVVCLSTRTRLFLQDVL
jgi:hypothetical protein